VEPFRFVYGTLGFRGTHFGKRCTRFRYLTDFQENNKCDSCFVTISNNIQVKYCRLDER